MHIAFSKLPIKSIFSKELREDLVSGNYTRQVKNAHFSSVDTKKPSNSEIVHISNHLLKELEVEIKDKNKFLNIVSGNEPFPDFKAFAMCYGGHQFGHWAGQLGDGRAINILETEIAGQPWMFQLKGAGPTPYSRSADGFAVLRSSIREYLCSEAMHHLGVPTTRALSIVKTGDLVTRDMLYNGNPQDEQGAVVCRVAPSFIRFGNFEILSARGETEELKQLVNFTIKHYFPHLGEPSKETYIAFFAEVAQSTQKMIVEWQRVGFVHGVMNTDNMSIHGLTIDYGPYGWLEDYDPSWTPNTTDREHRRYRFENQPNIALWNLVQLANALYPLIEEAKSLEEILDRYKSDYTFDYHKMMSEKLGLFNHDFVPENFIEELLENMGRSQIDMTLFFRRISENTSIDFDAFYSILSDVSYFDANALQQEIKSWETWFHSFDKLIVKENANKDQRSIRMKKVNPKYVLRNYMAQTAIDEAEKGNYQVIDELYNLLLNPYEEQTEMEKWFSKRPDWAKNKIGCSMLSCSS